MLRSTIPPVGTEPYELDVHIHAGMTHHERILFSRLQMLRYHQWFHQHHGEGKVRKGVFKTDRLKLKNTLLNDLESIKRYVDML
jgi:hypothetical protein